ncbi:MAG TPA: C1 family peptidase [Verrucomicrobiae bacterium]|nr:C1 family peptidase [Verrucomicrobiae bacterium]
MFSLATAGVVAVCIVGSMLNPFTRPSVAKSDQVNFDTYRFKDLLSLPATCIKTQGMSGTCWSFVGTSFLESELLRETGQEFDLSEMFVVRNAYFEKARNYILRQGTARFTEGGLVHDVLISAAKHGIATEDYYSGLLKGQTVHDHRKLFPALKEIVERHANPDQTPQGNWRNEFASVLDQYLGQLPAPDVKGKSLDPQEFLKRSKLDLNDYITLTSFNHAPFYASFVLEIPANYASERFYNLPLNEFMTNIDWALDHGFTVALDGDFTEHYFGNGAAVLPIATATPQQVSSGRFEEVNVTQGIRQAGFESFQTTDDHLMHIIGTAKDQFGRRYYKAKNCWGVEWGRAGFAYLSEAYIRMKAISVTLHKDGLNPTTRASLKLESGTAVSLNHMDVTK